MHSPVTGFAFGQMRGTSLLFLICLLSCLLLFLLRQFTADTTSLFSSSALPAAEVPVMVMVASSVKKSVRDLLISS